MVLRFQFVQKLMGKSLHIFLGLLLVIGLSSCALGDGEAFTPTPEKVAIPTATPTPVPSETHAPTLTETATATLTATVTLTSTETLTPTITPTPTFALPEGVVIVAQAFCRFGPGKAYLSANDLVAGDQVIVGGKDISGFWLYVNPLRIGRYCWSAASNFEITGDLKTVIVQQTRLPLSGFVNPPTGVSATRNGSEVTISWSPADYIPVGDRRGYLLELYLCQNGFVGFYAYATEKTSFTVTDESGCSQTSSGLLYIAEKHGYSESTLIPWP